MKKIGLLGGNGRMGKWVQQLLESEYSKKAELAIAPRSGESLAGLFECDAIIDFSSPLAALQFKREAMKRQMEFTPPIAVGSTGWGLGEEEELEELTGKTLLFVASNFSTGVYALAEILRQNAPLLKTLGYTPVILEGHHHHKKDAPSGTAITLQKIISPEAHQSVQTHPIRAGEIIGDHQVHFYGVADELQIGHRAQDRSIFARGAIDVALWLADLKAKDPSRTGRLTMADYFKTALGL
jgi:4-hydroxy-tetrahydrodipicolinate reductase